MWQKSIKTAVFYFPGSGSERLGEKWQTEFLEKVNRGGKGFALEVF
jgi:hypothetical protein